MAKTDEEGVDGFHRRVGVLFSASSLSFLRGMLSGKPGYRSAYVF